MLASPRIATKLGTRALLHIGEKDEGLWLSVLPNLKPAGWFTGRAGLYLELDRPDERHLPR